MTAIKNLLLPAAACGLLFTLPVPALSQDTQKSEPVPAPAAAPAENVAPTPEEAQEAPKAEEVPKATAVPAPKAVAVSAPVPELTAHKIINEMNIADLQEAMSQLKDNFIYPESLSDTELARAILEGMLVRLGPGASLHSSPNARATGESLPFYAEILDDRIAYMRIGALDKVNIEQLDASLKRFTDKQINSAVIDLRATQVTDNFDNALEIIKRFVPKGKLLLSIKKPSAKQERMITSESDPIFQGLIMLLVDENTAGAAEIVAAAIRAHSKSMIVGTRTAGQAVEYSDRQLKGGQVLRIAVAEVKVPGMPAMFPDGVKPDIEVKQDSKTTKTVMDAAATDGISQFVFDKPRTRMNEAALVAGEQPEIEDYRNFKANGDKHPSKGVKDKTLQRAVDLITTINIYEREPAND